MRVKCLSFMAFLGCGLTLSGQTDTPLSVAVEGADKPALVIRNTAQRIVTAFVLIYDVPVPQGGKIARMQAGRVYDAATEPLAARPLRPEETVRLACPVSSGCRDGSVKLQAAIFAFGPAWGDAAWIERLTRRRGYMEKSLRAAIAELEAALAKGSTRGQLISEFQTALSREQANAGDPDGRACAASVRGVVLKNLQGVQQNKNGSPVSVDSVIRHELGSLNVRLSALLSSGVL